MHTALADTLLKRFVKLTAEYYGEDVLSSNIHSLLHLAWQVESFGPLWCLSAMPFEALNFFFKRNFTGTVNHLGLQADRYLKKKDALRKKPKKDLLSKLCAKLKKEKPFKHRYLTSDGLASKFSLENSAKFYSNQKFPFFHVESVHHGTTKNSFVSFNCNGNKKFGQVQVFFDEGESNGVVIQEYRSVAFVRPRESGLQIYLYNELKKTENIRIIRQNQIDEKLIKVEYGNKFYFIPLVNCWEHD